MTVAVGIPPATAERVRGDTLTGRVLRSGRVVVGGGVLLIILLMCVGSLPWTLQGAREVEGVYIPPHPLFYDYQIGAAVRMPPLTDAQAIYGERLPFGAELASLFGYDGLGRSVLARCLLGGTISLAVGVAAASIAVVLGVSVGLVAGYKGGWVDSGLMRLVDVLYGLPYILLVILFKIAFETEFASGRWLPGLIVAAGVLVILGALIWAAGFLPRGWPRIVMRVLAVSIVAVAVWLLAGPLVRWVSTSRLRVPMTASAASIVVMFLAIGLVSWLTMARVVRGQVLSLRGQPFIEAARAMGLPPVRIFLRHVLPNLVGPVIVYATLTVPQAILQESFLSFLGVGVNPPMPTWGALASEALLHGLNPVEVYWWMLLFPCILLVVTLLSLNFMGDGLRDVFDPKRESAKI